MRRRIATSAWSDMGTCTGTFGNRVILSPLQKEALVGRQGKFFHRERELFIGTQFSILYTSLGVCDFV